MSGRIRVFQHHEGGGKAELKEGVDFLRKKDVPFGFDLLFHRDDCTYTWEFTMGKSKYKSRYKV